MIYRVESQKCGISESGARWMILHYWLLADDGEVLVRAEHALLCDGVWSGSGVLNPDCYEDAAPLLDMLAIMRSHALRELAWRDGEVEFAVERHPETGKAEIYVQAKLAL